MKQKMTSKLKELFPNLGLTDAVLEQVSGIAIVGLSADADDAAIEERAKSYEAMLKAFQSDTDRRVNEAVKKAGNKGGNSTTTTTTETGSQNGDMPEWFKTYSEKQDEERKTLLDKIAALEGKNAEKTFDELVAKVAGELGLSGSRLALAKRGLSTDMDEKKIKEEMGSVVKMLNEAGATTEEHLAGVNVTTDDVARENAKKWVEEHAVK